MDFGTLLHVAKKNSENNKNDVKYYSTKYAPPKKESKEKKLSANIQRFLQKREQEEKERKREEKQKLANLLAMRDEKSKNKIKKMLKVTKSANKSVLDDAVNLDHTAITLEGPEQPDQDDYGYVSTEANAFYQKYIEKVKDVKEDKGFAPSRPQSLRDLSGTKERVKAAITKEIEEKRNHTRQRTSTSTSLSNSEVSSNTTRVNSTSKTLYDGEKERREEEQKKREEEQRKNKNRKPAPPPMDFQALLKLAEKKQHEPIEIVTDLSKNKKEPERLLTLKEKREMEERQRAKEARERRDRQRNDAVPETNRDRKDSGGTTRMEPNGRIPKLNQAARSLATTSPSILSKNSNVNLHCKSTSNGQNSSNIARKISNTSERASLVPSSSKKGLTSFNSKSSESLSNSKMTSSACVSSTKSSSTASHATQSITPSALTHKKNSRNNSVSTTKSLSNGSSRELVPRDIKANKTKQLTPSDGQITRAFPPTGIRNRPIPSKKPIQAPKRRILDDDDDEYDSELDDFIDDGDCEEDYSSHIKEIFGYDKSKYRDLDEGDDTAMESNFAQVQREEYISKKIGIQEDLEDMKLEAIEKKRKSMKKRRLDV